MTRLASKKRTIALIIVAILVASTIIGVALNSGGTESKVVARVSGQEITKDDLYDFLVKSYGQQGVNILVTNKIVELEAEKQDIKITEDDVQKEIDKMTEEYGGEESFNMILQYSGMTIDDMKENVRMNMHIEKILGPSIEITEEEMKNYFEENKESFSEKEQVKASHILVETEEEAVEVKSKLDNGDDFAKLAKKHSTDPGSKDNGGDLGFFGKGKMVKEFEDVAFSLKVGEISEPVKSEHGYHIIKVEDKKAAKEANYEESKEEIEEAIFNEKIPTEYQTWMQQKFSEYEIETYL